MVMGETSFGLILSELPLYVASLCYYKTKPQFIAFCFSCLTQLRLLFSLIFFHVVVNYVINNFNFFIYLAIYIYMGFTLNN